MCFLHLPRRAGWAGVFTAALLLFMACDMPSSAPSFETETGLNSPVVVKKTFSLLGGEKSSHEPLIDTTTSQFDSLFTVGASDQGISIEEEVSSFDLKSPGQILEKATEDVETTTLLTEAVVQGTNFATQTIDAGFRQENGVPPPTRSTEATVNVARDTIPFPPGLLALPDFGTTDIQADSLKQGTLTTETSVNGTTVNTFTFTLFNDPADPTLLTDGNGNPPAVKIRDESGDVIANKSFDASVSSGESESVEIGVEGETLGEDSEVVLVVDGNDSKDELTIKVSPLRYRNVTLGGVDGGTIAASETDVSTRAGSGASQFAGTEPRSGTLRLDVANNFSFPIEIDTLLLENNLQGSPLPDSFPAFDVFRDSGPIASGATETFEIDLGDKGIANGIDVRLKAALAQSGTTVTLAATDNLDVSASGGSTIEAVYFWPAGEQVQAGGRFNVEQDRVSFDQSSNFVELSAGTLAFNNVVSEPEVAFESFTVSFPDLQSDPYGPEDSLTVSFPVDVESSPTIDPIDLSDVRVSPTDDVVDYHLQGTLETIAPSDRTADNLRVLRYTDKFSAALSIDSLGVRALEAGINPFTINMTGDANGDGKLDLSDPEEASQESFGELDGLAERVDGLELTGSELKFRVATDVGTDAQVYAALRGQSESSRTFLAGTGSEKSVPSTSSTGDNFYDGSAPIANEDLIQFGVNGAPTDDPVTRRIALTDENSTVDDFLSLLPPSLRFIAQARITGNDAGRIRLRRPLALNVGLSVAIPVRLNSTFTVQDTIDADFSALEDVTDPNKEVTLSTAELRVRYTNGVPLGIDARFIALDDSGSEVVSLPGEGETVRLRPAPKAADGAANGTQSGTAVLDLSKNELRDLAHGRQLHLRMTMDQAEEGGPATLRATDTIELSLEAKVEASVSVNN